jgi:hypothetical protein
MKDHRLIDARSLVFDQRIAARLRSEPALLERARAILLRWLGSCAEASRPDLREWQALIDGPREVLLRTLEGTDERCVRLRQSSPFCGILTPEERNAILKEFQARDAAAA